MLAIAGVAFGAHSIAAKRHKRALLILGVSLPLAALAASAWLALFRSPPERDVAIDFRKEIPPGWIEATFPSCRPSPIRSTTTCDSNDYINKLQLTLPDDLRLQATAKSMSVSYAAETRRLTSLNVLVHPYLSAADASSLHATLMTSVAKEAKNSARATSQGSEVASWLKEWEGAGENKAWRSPDNYVCIERSGYNFCLRYRRSSYEPEFAVTYEIETRS